MVKDYDGKMAVRGAINRLLYRARALDFMSARLPSTIKLATAARAGSLLGVAFKLYHDVLTVMPDGSMYDLMKEHRDVTTQRPRPSARRGRW